MNEIIRKKANEIAEKHVLILEDECKKVCNRFGVEARDLMIEYHTNTEIKIKLLGSHFKITNNFVFENGNCRESDNLMEIPNE